MAAERMATVGGFFLLLAAFLATTVHSITGVIPLGVGDGLVFCAVHEGLVRRIAGSD
jgi:hypothetical protein